jgi:hypothetical protein
VAPTVRYTGDERGFPGADLPHRETHDTFEAYCRERWEMSKPQATRVLRENLICLWLLTFGLWCFTVGS